MESTNYCVSQLSLPQHQFMRYETLDRGIAQAKKNVTDHPEQVWGVYKLVKVVRTQYPPILVEDVKEGIVDYKDEDEDEEGEE